MKHSEIHKKVKVGKNFWRWKKFWVKKKLKKKKKSEKESCLKLPKLPRNHISRGWGWGLPQTTGPTDDIAEWQVESLLAAGSKVRLKKTDTGENCCPFSKKYQLSFPDLCNQTLYLQPGDTGHISSPGYPSPNPANTLCEYQLKVFQPDQRIKLTFVGEFSIASSEECKEDFLHVGNNMNLINIRSLTSYKICGKDPPKEIVSRSNEMWLVFKSVSQSSVTRGFNLTYQVSSKGNWMHCTCSFYFPSKRSLVAERIQNLGE